MNISNKGDKGFKRVWMSMCERKVPCDISNEFTMPDYKPEIRRVLHVTSVISQPTRYINSNVAEFNGNIDYNVLYVGADGELHSMPFSAEYSFEVPVDADGFDFKDEITSCCDTLVEGINVRVLGPRKLNVKCRLNSQVRIYGQKFIDQDFDLENSKNCIQTLEAKVNNSKIIRVCADTLDISDETHLSGINQGVITANANVHIHSIKTLNDMVSVDGDIILKLLCADMEDTFKNKVVTKKIPYSTEIEAEGSTPESICIAKGYVDELNVTVEEDRIICDMSVCLQLEGQTDEEISFVRDLYSTKRESTCLQKSYNIPCVGYAENGNFSMNEKLSREGLVTLPETFEIVDVYGCAASESIEENDGKLELRGSSKFTLIIKSNDEYSSQDITLPLKYVFDSPGKNITSYCNEMSVISCTARWDGEFVSIDAEVGVVSVGLSLNEVSVVDEVKLGEDIEKSKSAITVVYPSADEDLWSVAKRYHVPICEIEMKNPDVLTVLTNTYLIV